MRGAGNVVRAVLDAVEAACVPGATTAELDRIAERELARRARSAFLGYRPGSRRPIPPCCAPRSTTSWCTASRARRGAARGRRHRHRLRVLQGRLLRRRRPHGRGRRGQRARARAARRPPATRSTAAIAQCVPGDRLGDIGAAIQELRRSARLRAGPRLRRSRHRPRHARAAAGAELRPPGQGLRLKPGW